MLSGRRDADGFTLVELLVVVLVLGVVGTIVTSGLVGAMRTTRQTQERIEAFNELQMTAERVSRELRVACPMRAIDSDDVTVEIDRDSSRYRHRFWVASAQLHHAIDVDNSGTWDPLIANRVLLDPIDAAVGATFTYLDSDGAVLDLADPATLPRDVRTVELVLGRDLAEQDPVQVTTTIHLRNGGAQCI